MNNNIFLKVSAIIKKQLQQPALELKETTGSKDVEGWDSLQHVMIIADVENEFAIKIDLLELLNMKTVGDICNTVEKLKS